MFSLLFSLLTLPQAPSLFPVQRKLPLSFIFLNFTNQNGILKYPGYHHFSFSNGFPKQLPKGGIPFLPSAPTLTPYLEWSFSTTLTSVPRPKLALKTTYPTLVFASWLFTHLLYWLELSSWKTLPLLFGLKLLSLNISSSKEIVPDFCPLGISATWSNKHLTSHMVAFFSLLFLHYLLL